MRICSLSCKKHADDMVLSKLIRQAPKCDKCVARKSTFFKKKSLKDPINLKSLVLTAI